MKKQPAGKTSVAKLTAPDISQRTGTTARKVSPFPSSTSFIKSITSALKNKDITIHGGVCNG